MVNLTIMQGRLTAAPELRQTPSGVSVLNFTLAWSEKRNEIEEKCFLNCTAWQKTAEFISKYFTKGQEIIIVGKLKTRQWVDDDGNNRYALDLTVDTANFCGKKQSEAPAQTSGSFDTPENTSLPSGSDFGADVSEDKLPF